MSRQEWLVQVVVRADQTEIEEIAERVGKVNCLSPDHDGPCETPWTLVSTAVDDLEEPAQQSWRALLDS